MKLVGVELQPSHLCLNFLRAPTELRKAQCENMQISFSLNLSLLIPAPCICKPFHYLLLQKKELEQNIKLALIHAGMLAMPVILIFSFPPSKCQDNVLVPLK